MPKLYILDVPEFAAIAKSLADQNISCVKRAGYFCFVSDQPIKIIRHNMIDATWFGFPIAGIEGNLVEHSDKVFRLE